MDIDTTVNLKRNENKIEYNKAMNVDLDWIGLKLDCEVGLRCEIEECSVPHVLLACGG